ncbi:hypothetical protein ACFVYP_31210 [Kitasatospora sp. NPDC058201]|uniref:hypothetical protein n=1 Tax=Kitasatospora sp. NPDC058201 TaxID=3346379 RepID=UPI0036DD405B
MESCPDHYSVVPTCFDCCRAALSAVPSDVEELTRLDPDAFAAFAGSHRAWVENLLLAECAHRPMVAWSRSDSPPLVVQWAVRATPAVAVGLTRAYRQREGDRGHALWISRLPLRIDSGVDQRLAGLWCDLALLAGEQDPVAESGLRTRVDRRARPTVWARSLEWLLLWGRQLRSLDVAFTLALAGEHPTVRQAVSRCARSPVLGVQLRAAGLQAAMKSARPLEDRLLDIVSASVDDRRSDFPRPLGAPSSTWLADHGLEGLVRGAARRAVADFAGSIGDLGAAEEEHLTATLLAGLVREFTALPSLTRLAAVPGPHLRVGHRTVTKKEERTNGADIGVVVDIRVPGRLQLRTGDLIQVKKSTALTPGRGRTGREDTWTVKRRQLHDLLEHSASAVYWLIRGSGDVLVVPAKFLAAVEGAAALPSSKQFTVGHTAVRHTAVPMEQYLPDLVVGLWLGSSSDRTLQAAQGTGRTTRPRFALTIDVVLEPGEG